MAQKRNLQEIAITDHGPANIFAGVKNNSIYLKIKEEVKKRAKNFPQLKVMVGAEANIIGLQGQIDIDKKIIKQLDLLLVGLHPYVKPIDWNSAFNFVVRNQLSQINRGQREKVKNINTKTLLEAVHKNDCLAITHPGLNMPIDYKELAKGCVKTNTALEINAGHKFPGLEEILEAADSGVDFIVNSDSHFPHTVGELSYGGKVLKKAKIDLDRIINIKRE